MDNVLENDQYLFHFSYSVLTDQQSKVQAIYIVYHKGTIIQLLLYWTIANSSLIHMMCVPLGIIGFLFLCHLENVCLFIVWVTYQRLPDTF